MKIIEINEIENLKLSNKINLIDINLQKSNNKLYQIKLSNKYISDSFNVAFKLLKMDLLINLLMVQ